MNKAARSAGAAPQGKNPMDSFLALPLTDARLQLKNRITSLPRDCGNWTPLDCPTNWLGRHSLIGVFEPRRNWDEPLSMPNIGAKTEVAYSTLDAPMKFKHCSNDELIWDKTFQVLVAPASAPDADPKVIFVPCLMADLKGNRIGRGGGFYDRYLDAHPEVFSIGILHDDYVVSQLPQHWLHENDQRISALITNTSTHYFNKEKPSP